MSHILVIDDEPSICWGLAELGKRLSHDVATAPSAELGLQLAQERRPDLVLLDVRLPGMDGLTALPRLRELVASAPIVVMTAHGDLSTAVETVRQGAFDYVAKPFDLAQIETIIQRSLAEPATAPAPIERNADADGLIGRTPAMQEVFKRIALVAPSSACVLLAGESGTGKELVARAIHRYSRRHDQPFVAVNVAALSPALAESELFGHVRGAFTGADQPRKGLLLEADGGTLFLDEVADIPLPVQVKLLRALEQGEVMPVGSGQTHRTNLRVIAATHQNLPAKIQAGEFRHDLYYRLAAFEIALPPLRDRRDDAPRLADHFLRQFAPAAGAAWQLSEAALAELKNRDWQGNVRELRNAIEHATVLARDGVIRPEHLPPPLPSIRTEASAKEASNGAALRDDIRQLLERWTQQRLDENPPPQALHDELLALVEPPVFDVALEKHRGQCATAARTLGLHRTTLKKKLDQYGIAGDEDSDDSAGN